MSDRVAHRKQEWEKAAQRRLQREQFVKGDLSIALKVQEYVETCLNADMWEDGSQLSPSELYELTLTYSMVRGWAYEDILEALDA